MHCRGNTTVCTECYEGMGVYLDASSGLCAPCKSPGCASCPPEDPSYCTACVAEGWVLDPSAYKCIE